MGLDLFTFSNFVALMSILISAIAGTILGVLIEKRINREHTEMKHFPLKLASTFALLLFGVFLSFFTNATNIQITENTEEIKTLINDPNAGLAALIRAESKAIRESVEATYNGLNSDDSNTNQRLAKIQQLLTTLMVNTNAIDENIKRVSGVISDMKVTVDGISSSSELALSLLKSMDSRVMSKQDFDKKLNNIETISRVNSNFSEKLVALYVDKEYRPRLKPVTDNIIKFLYSQTLFETTKAPAFQDKAKGFLQKAREENKKDVFLFNFTGKENEQIIDGLMQTVSS